MAKRKGLMDSLMDPMPGDSAGLFDDQVEASDEETNQSLQDKVTSSQAELAKVDEAITALTGAVKASDKPSSTLLAKLGEYKSRREQLQAELDKAGSAKPTESAAAPEAQPSVSGPTPTAAAPTTPSIDNKPKTLMDALNKSAPTGKAPAPDYFQQAEDVTKAGAETLKGKLAEAETKREEARGRADVGQLAETLGKSFAQIGAAQAGLKSGVDLSQAVAKAPGVDWESRRKEIQDDYQLRLKDIEMQRKDLADKADHLEKRGEFETSKKLKEKELSLEQAKVDQMGEYRKAEIENAKAKLEASKRSLNPDQFKVREKGLDIYGKAVDEFEKNTAVYDRMQAAKNSYDKAPEGSMDKVYSSIQMIMLSNKALDPTSTIRESEYDRLAKAGDWTGFMEQAKADGIKGAALTRLRTIADSRGGGASILPSEAFNSLYKTGMAQRGPEMKKFAGKLNEIRQDEKKFGIPEELGLSFRPEYEQLLGKQDKTKSAAGATTTSPTTPTQVFGSAEEYLKGNK